MKVNLRSILSLGIYISFLLIFFSPGFINAKDDLNNLPTVIQSTLSPQGIKDTQDISSFRYQLRIMSFLFMISLVPFGVMMLTSFTRISIIFHFLRQALGSPQVPSNQIVIGISIILTGFIMHPVINDIQNNAIKPYLNSSLNQTPEVKQNGTSEEELLIARAWKPLRTFLLEHVREKDLQLFLDIAHIQIEQNPVKAQTPSGRQFHSYNFDSIPWYCIIPAFVMSELRLAFMIGFLLFLPFLIIDMVIASVLMSMGMMMLPPVLVSTPFKLLLFILIDGWRLIIQQIVNGYNI